MGVQTFAGYPFNSRGWRAILFPVLVWMFASYFSSKAQVCPGLALKCVRMKSDGKWWKAFVGSQTSLNARMVTDPLVMKRNKEISNGIIKRAMILAILGIGITLALPPGYGIHVHD
jgi:hypothetical protein